MMAQAFRTDAIDCDVHVAPPSLQALFGYLSDYWRQYITEAGVRLTHMAHAYPQATLAGPVPHSYDELVQSYLEPAQPRLAVLHCVSGFETHRNPYFSAAIASAINDWMAEEFLARDERLRAGLTVSAISPQDARAEIERIGDQPGFVHVLLPVRSDVPWGNKNNHAMIEAARERSLHIALHAWGRPGKAPTPSGFTTTFLEDYIGNQPIAQAQLLSFVAEGVFERFPDLRVTVAECGFAWLPPLLWRFDKDWKGVWREVPWVKRPPSEYVGRHFLFTTAPAHVPDDPSAVDQLLEMLGGSRMLVYASDHPHEHGGSGIEPLLERLSEEDREALLRGTAAELYGAPQPAET